MHKSSHFCHSVAGIVMLLGVFFSNSASANGQVCSKLFNNGTTIQDIEASLANGKIFDNTVFTTPDAGMAALKNGVLAQIRTADPSRDHIQYFAEQLPVILLKLEVKFVEAETFLLRHDRGSSVSLEARKRELAGKIKQAHDLMMNEASSRVNDKSVTYEWYMEFFLKALVFNDSATTIVKYQGNSGLGTITKRMETLLGSKAVYSGETSESLIYSALSKETSLIKQNYFARHLPENAMVPVLFKPRNSDIIEAEKYGLRFITLRPIEEVNLQVEQALKQIQNSRNLILQSRWLKYHNKIVEKIKGDAALESLYVYVIRDAGLQAEIASRSGVASTVTQLPTEVHGRVIVRGHRTIYTGYENAPKKVVVDNSHKVSEYLTKYLRDHHLEIEKISDHRTVEAFLRVISHIEKEALASH